METNKPQRRPSHLPPITKELVFQIADGLKAEKKRVTNETVRAALQGGSLLTIAPLVREWHQNEDSRFRLALEEIPDGVEEAAVLAAKAIWKIASDLASHQLKEQGKKMQEMEADHLQQVQAYEQEIANLEAERETLISEREQTKATLQERNGELAAVKAKLAETTQALTLATLRGQDLERDRLKLEAELKAARDDAAQIGKDFMKSEALLEIEKEDRQKAEEALTMAQKSIQDLTAQVSNLQQKLAVEQQKNRGLNEQSLHLKEQLEKEQDNNTKNSQLLHDIEVLYRQGLEDYRQANAAAVKRAEKAESEAGEFQDAANRLADKCDEYQDLVEKLKEQLAALQKEQQEESRKTAKKGKANEAPVNP